jgi:Raf kinase inhibitor-like YbhB/YbcL family protein
MLTLRSPAFGHEQVIPSKYTCDGDDIHPPLAIDSIPEGTVSLALIVDDPDAPNGTWDHWLVWNMPGALTRIGEGDAPEGVRGVNSWGRLGYGGPCPPNGEHRYLFKVYALDTLLELPEGASKAQLLAAMQGHVLESTTLMGCYTRVS